MQVSTEFVKFDFIPTDGNLQATIVLTEFQSVHTVFIMDLTDFDSWQLTFHDGTIHTAEKAAIYTCAKATIPHEKFDRYRKLVDTGRMPLYLVDPNFPGEYYADMQHKITLVDAYGNSCSFEMPERQYNENPPSFGVEDYTQNIFKSIKNGAVVTINNSKYDKVPSLWAQVITRTMA